MAGGALTANDAVPAGGFADEAARGAAGALAANSRTSTTAAWPPRFARSSAVKPRKNVPAIVSAGSACEASAPAASSSRTAPAWPIPAALSSGAQPLRSSAPALAPAASSSRIIASFPFDAAQYSAVRPPASRASGAAPSASSRRTRAASPWWAARVSCVVREKPLKGSRGRARAARSSAATPCTARPPRIMSATSPRCATARVSRQRPAHCQASRPKPTATTRPMTRRKRSARRSSAAPHGPAASPASDIIRGRRLSLGGRREKRRKGVMSRRSPFPVGPAQDFQARIPSVSLP